MHLGVPKEIKVHEYRVGMTPASVREVVDHGHSVTVQTKAGDAIGFSDEDFQAAGAEIVESAEEVFATAEMIVKVKEPQAQEIAMLRQDQILFTYLHLAPDAAQTKGLLDSGCIGIAYETVTDQHGGLPLLAPMSEVAGRMSIQAGAHCLEMEPGGRGVLLGGVPGVPSGKVVVIGGGVVGTNAARMAVGLECDVVIIDRSIQRLAQLDEMFRGRINTIYSTKGNIEEQVTQADLVVGAVLVPGAAAPSLVTRDMIGKMKRGSVIVDVAIDQGGCCETSKATTHSDPTYVVDGVVHYCVANMPGGVARTSTLALNNATLPFTLALANKGYRQALLDDPHLCAGLNVHTGQLTYEAVARDQNLTYVAAHDVLAA
jgi:alanine dehydrogenase